jgi:hypothetical protein
VRLLSASSWGKTAMVKDTMTLCQDVQDDEATDEQNLIGLAIVKAHAFSQEYDSSTGRIKDRPNYHALKEGYTAGFLAGFTYKFTGEIEL